MSMQLTDRQQQARRRLESMSETHRTSLRSSPGYVLGLIDAGQVPGHDAPAETSEAAPPAAPAPSAPAAPAPGAGTDRYGWLAIAERLAAEIDGGDDA